MATSVSRIIRRSVVKRPQESSCSILVPVPVPSLQASPFPFALQRHTYLASSWLTASATDPQGYIASAGRSQVPCYTPPRFVSFITLTIKRSLDCFVDCFPLPGILLYHLWVVLLPLPAVHVAIDVCLINHDPASTYTYLLLFFALQPFPNDIGHSEWPPLLMMAWTS